MSGTFWSEFQAILVSPGAEIFESARYFNFLFWLLRYEVSSFSIPEKVGPKDWRKRTAMAASRARKIQAKANSRDTGYSPTQTKNCRKKTNKQSKEIALFKLWFYAERQPCTPKEPSEVLANEKLLNFPKKMVKRIYPIIPWRWLLFNIFSNSWPVNLWCLCWRGSRFLFAGGFFLNTRKMKEILHELIRITYCSRTVQRSPNKGSLLSHCSGGFTISIHLLSTAVSLLNEHLPPICSTNLGNFIPKSLNNSVYWRDTAVLISNSL